MREEEAITLIMALFILAGAGMLYVAIINRRKVREMEHRERLAMIERGLMPPPERDPAAFEAHARLAPAVYHDVPANAAAARFRTIGVLMIGFGLGLMMLITFAAGQPEVGVGVGGGFAILGVAALLNYFLMSKREGIQYGVPPARWTPPSTPPEPPSNVAP